VIGKMAMNKVLACAAFAATIVAAPTAMAAGTPAGDLVRLNVNRNNQ